MPEKETVASALVAIALGLLIGAVMIYLDAAHWSRRPPTPLCGAGFAETPSGECLPQ